MIMRHEIKLIFLSGRVGCVGGVGCVGRVGCVGLVGLDLLHCMEDFRWPWCGLHELGARNTYFSRSQPPKERKIFVSE